MDTDVSGTPASPILAKTRVLRFRVQNSSAPPAILPSGCHQPRVSTRAALMPCWYVRLKIDTLKAFNGKLANVRGWRWREAILGIFLSWRCGSSPRNWLTTWVPGRRDSGGVFPHAAESNGSSQTCPFHCKDRCSSRALGSLAPLSTGLLALMYGKRRLTFSYGSRCAFPHNIPFDGRQPASGTACKQSITVHIYMAVNDIGLGAGTHEAILPTLGLR